MKVIMAKDSAFILLRLRRNSPGLTVQETTLKDGDFPLRPSQSYELNKATVSCLYTETVINQIIYQKFHEFEPMELPA